MLYVFTIDVKFCHVQFLLSLIVQTTTLTFHEMYSVCVRNVERALCVDSKL